MGGGRNRHLDDLDAVVLVLAVVERIHVDRASSCRRCGRAGADLVLAVLTIVAAPAVKKFLTMSGINDCYTQSSGSTRTMGNFLMAVFSCIKQSYSYLTPDMWVNHAVGKAPFQEFTDYLAKSADRKPAAVKA